MSCPDNVIDSFRVKTTQLEMLMERGFNIRDEDYILKLGLEYPDEAHLRYHQLCQQLSVETEQTVRQMMTRIYDSMDGTRRVLVYYPETPSGGKKVGKDVTQQIVLKLQTENLAHVIIISDAVLSPDFQKEFINMPSYRMEYFRYNDLMFNPTKHFLNSKHQLLSREEGQKILKDARDKNIEFENFSKMSYQDMTARYYGALPGRIFAINRRALGYSTLAADTLTYRIVSTDSLPKLNVPVQKTVESRT